MNWLFLSDILLYCYLGNTQEHDIYSKYISPSTSKLCYFNNKTLLQMSTCLLPGWNMKRSVTTNQLLNTQPYSDEAVFHWAQFCLLIMGVLGTRKDIQAISKAGDKLSLWPRR